MKNHQIRGNYLIGYSAIDVTTAKCYYNEVFGTNEDKFFALDEVFITTPNKYINKLSLF